MEAGEVSGGLIRALHGRPLINLYIISYLGGGGGGGPGAAGGRGGGRSVIDNI
jgi:hypothetical protein